MEQITLYITTDYKISKEADRILLFRDENSSQSFPIIAIKTIVIIGNVTLESNIISLFKEYNIMVHFISLNGKYYGSLNFAPSGNVFIRVKQYKTRFDKEKSLQIAYSIVEKKLQRQKWFCSTYRIDFDISNLVEHKNNIEEDSELFGLEGSKAKEYFNNFKILLKNPDFKWEYRSKYPPKDEINALLSLCYTLLQNEVWTVCNILGLDPYLGFFHKDTYNRPSLVCDLMEQYRPYIDKFVINLINLKQLQLKDFERNSLDGGVSVRLKNFGSLIAKWNEFLKEKIIVAEEYTLQELIRKDINDFKEQLLAEE